MQLELDQFIGRTAELEQVEKAIGDSTSSSLGFIWGAGGVGKTRLLRELEERNRHNSSLIFVPIIDFDDGKYRIGDAVYHTIATFLQRTIPGSPFDEYFEELSQLEEANLRISDSPAVTRRQFRINQVFTDCFNRSSQNGRIVLRIDTAEVMRGTNILANLIESFHGLKQVVTIVAGRPPATELLFQRFRSEQTLVVWGFELEPFSFEDSRQYLRQKQKDLQVKIQEEYIELMHLCAGGKPVLIDLAIEHALHNDLPFDAAIQSIMKTIGLPTYEALVAQLLEGNFKDKLSELQISEISQSFERTLVQSFVTGSLRFDQLRLVLAKVYPLDIEGVVALLGIQSEEAQLLYDIAVESVSIKLLPDGRLKLHDEVQRLVNEYAWTEYDTNGQREILNAHRAVTYLETKSRRLLGLLSSNTESDRTDLLAGYWTSRVEQLRQRLFINISDGYQFFEEMFASAQGMQEERIDVRSGDAQLRLFDTLSPYISFQNPTRDSQGQSLPVDTRYDAKFAHVDVFERAARFREAVFLCQELIDNIGLVAEDKVKQLLKAKRKMAFQQVYLGHLRQAERTLEDVLSQAESQNLNEIHIETLNDLGWVNRRLGNWEDAIKYYGNALNLSMGKDNIRQMAMAYNNRAYVFALMRRQREAFANIDTAIKLRSERVVQAPEEQFLLGQSYNTAIEVYAEFDLADRAREYYQLAWNIFEKEPDGTPTWKSKARSARGFCSYQLARKLKDANLIAEAEQELRHALDDLDWALNNATALDGPSFQSRLGEVYYQLNQYEKALGTWSEGLREASDIGDAHAALLCLTNLARLGCILPTTPFLSVQELYRYYHVEYRRQFPNAWFEEIKALFDVSLGHLSLLDEATYDDALRYYQTGLPVLVRMGGNYPPYTAVSQIEFIEEVIAPKIGGDRLGQLGKDLKDFWSQAGTDDLTLLYYFRKWERRAGGK